MQFLRDHRAACGFTANEMAQRLGISPSLYTKVECDARLPSQNFLSRFKLAFPAFDMNIFFNHRNHNSRISQRDNLLAKERMEELI